MQLDYVIKGLLHFSIHSIYPKIVNKKEVASNYLITIKKIFEYVLPQESFKEFYDKYQELVKQQQYDFLDNFINNLELVKQSKLSKNEDLKSKESSENLLLEKSRSQNRTLSTNISMSTTQKLSLDLNSAKNTSTNKSMSHIMDTTSLFKPDTEREVIHSTESVVSKEQSHDLKLPYISLTINNNISENNLKKLFISEMNKVGCNLSLVDDSCVSARKNSTSLMNCILKTFNFSSVESDEFKIYFRIKNPSLNYQRQVELIGINGNYSSCVDIINQFIRCLIKNAHNVKIVRKKNLDITDIMNEIVEKQKEINNMSDNKIPKSSMSHNDDKDEQESVLEKINKEASSFYEFYSILSDERYDLGRDINKFIEKFKNENEDSFEVYQKLPQQMNIVNKFINETVSTFHSYYNFGNNITEKKLKFCKPAVEKFIFTKLDNSLYKLYLRKYKKENIEFLATQTRIKKELSITNILDYLEVREKFRGRLDKSESDKTNLRTSPRKEQSLSNIPYKNPIDCLNKIELELTPEDKFDCLVKTSLELRNCVLDYTKGKEESFSYDDELPIFIYLCTQVNLKNFLAELNLIEDYLKFTNLEFPEANKVLFNMKLAIQFISKDWNFTIKETKESN